jgi:hypothetical protein
MRPLALYQGELIPVTSRRFLRTGAVRRYHGVLRLPLHSYGHPRHDSL